MLTGVKVREIFPRTGLDEPWGLHEVEALKTFTQQEHKAGKVVSPTLRPPLRPREDPWYSFLLGTQSITVPQRGRENDVTGVQAKLLRNTRGKTITSHDLLRWRYD
jgi:hypothetical protein